jgi:hypothetical protein
LTRDDPLRENGDVKGRIMKRRRLGKIQPTTDDPTNLVISPYYNYDP